jgi:hypothetical protein
LIQLFLLQWWKIITVRIRVSLPPFFFEFRAGALVLFLAAFDVKNLILSFRIEIQLTPRVKATAQFPLRTSICQEFPVSEGKATVPGAPIS